LTANATTGLVEVLTCIKHRITNAVARGLNCRIATVQYRVQEFGDRHCFRIADYFIGGGLYQYFRFQRSMGTGMELASLSRFVKGAIAIIWLLP
jgi:hypothetical protein